MICKKNFKHCGKTSKFLPKKCLFIFCIFYLNEEESIQQACPRKHIENEIFNSTSHKTKIEEEQKYNPTS